MALAPLFVSVAVAQSSGKSALHVVSLGLLTGAVYFGGTLYWVVGVMTTYGGLPLVVGVLIGVLMVAYVSIYPAMVALLLARAVRTFGVTGVWLAPCFWVAAEWIRSSFGGGFPWVLLGSSQARVTPIVQLASVAGVFGLSWLVALASAAAAAIVLSRRRVHVAGAAGVALLVVSVGVLGALRVREGSLVRSGAPMRIGLIQGNVEQDAKWDPRLGDPIMARQLDLSRQVIANGAALVIWPESSTPFYFEIDAARADPVRRLAAQSRTPFLIGTDEYERTLTGEQLYNSAVLVGPDGRTRSSYRKMLLVPFGEYVPMKRLLFFVGPLVQAVSDFSAGTEPHVFDVDGHHVSVAICYESVFPWIARAFVERGSELLATVTNDAWFDRSSAAYQHFEQGAIRAVEEGRYVVRAANTGISGAVDPYGRSLVETPLFELTAVPVDIRLLSGRTIYSRVGDLMAWLSLAVTAWAVWATRRPKRSVTMT